MKTTEVIEKLGLTIISGENGLNREVKGCYVSDLLSDVMGNAAEGALWITLQTHQNVVAIASLKDLAGVILVRGLLPTEDTIERSNSENVPLLSTELDTFTVAGRLYELINR